MIRSETLDGIGTVAVAYYRIKKDGSQVLIIIPEKFGEIHNEIVEHCNLKIISKKKFFEMSTTNKMSLMNALLLEKWDFEKFPVDNILVHHCAVNNQSDLNVTPLWKMN